MNDQYQSECRVVSELLIALAADELEPERAAQLHTHIAQCSTCQAELAASQQAYELAAGLKLDSPALDRYPEFLRRLAADETARVQGSLVRLTEPAVQVDEATEFNAEATERPNSGVAAIVPLLGRRVMLRSGFGKGFELTVVSPRGRELFRLATTSLTRVAAVAAGISLFAGLSVVGVIVLFTSFWRAHPQAEQQAKPQPSPEFPEHRVVVPPVHDWVQTFSHKGDTLAVWPERGQLLVNWLGAGTETPPVTLALPRFGGERLPPLPRMIVTGASDGHGAVVVREAPEGFFVWHVAADASRRVIEPIQPVKVAQRGVHPALAWFGDRYLLAFVNPSQTAPYIELLTLDRAGEPLQERGLLAATTERGDKVGLPSLAGLDRRGALFFFTEKGELQGCTLELEQERVELGERIHITTIQRKRRTPVQSLALADGGFLLCWGEMEDDRFELRLARLNAQLQTQTVATVVATAAPVPSFDWRIDGAELLFTWLEEQPDKSQIFTQRFDFDGTARTAPQLVPAPIAQRSGLAFADEAGRKLVWTRRSIDGAAGLETKTLR